MRITQAAGIVTKVAKDQWATLIALNDEEGGPNGVRITIVNEDQFNQPTPSRAAKCALEVINGLNLENLVAEKLPVLHGAGAEPVEVEVTQEFRDHLIPLNFDAGRYRIDVGPQGQVRLSGAFIDHARDNVFLWTLSPRNDLLPTTVTDAAKLGAGMLRGLGLKDVDHGQHLVNGPDVSRVVDDMGHEVTQQ